jgi:hypothetical protein
MKKKKKNIGSSFDDWLRKEGLYEDATAVAIKRVLARPSLRNRKPLPVTAKIR